MHILTKGRRSFLDYLRNAAPQGVLLAIGLLAGKTLDFTRFHWANWPITVIFFGSLAFCVLAFIANTLEFLAESSKSLRRYDRAMRLLSRKGVRRWRPFVATLRIMARREPWKIFEMALTIALAFVMFIAVVVLGYNTASALSR